MPFDFSEMRSLGSEARSYDPESPNLKDRMVFPEEFEAYIATERQSLLDRVERGEITPKAAEEEAMKRLNRPLQTRFDPTVDVRELVNWTPEMVAAWISEKDLRAVHRHHELSYKGKTIWVRNSNVHRPQGRRVNFDYGYDLVPLGPTSLFEEFSDFAGSPKNYSDMRWYSDLRQLLAEGRRITADGIRSGGKRNHVAVKRRDWLTAEFVKDQKTGETVLKVGDKTVYRQVMFPAYKVMECFPKSHGFIRQPNHLRPVRRWKTDIGKLTPQRQKVFNVLRAEWKDGIPVDFDNDQQRLDEVRRLLGSLYWHDDQDSFKRFLNRLLRRVCE